MTRKGRRLFGGDGIVGWEARAPKHRSTEPEIDHHPQRRGLPAPEPTERRIPHKESP
ncbi:MAG: hypothetical protein M3494_07255 [Actinomycetota bacterium]|jgi:hypothetical protein|nr:hypothetical protein [Rubrobacter sp.]MDQ3507794.1 hypothetical protein [Actinomycetota bacterium]